MNLILLKKHENGVRKPSSKLPSNKGNSNVYVENTAEHLETPHDKTYHKFDVSITISIKTGIWEKSEL